MPGFAIRGPVVPINAAAAASVSGAASAVAGQSVPNWAGTPSPTIYEGIAGNYTLPVTGLVGDVAWSQPGAKPAWLSFSGNVLSWTSAAAQQTISGVVLRATNAAGTSDSAAFALTVNAAPSSTGFFAGATVSQRTLVTSANDAQASGISHVAKHTSWVSHPDGRDWVFGGDWRNTSGNDNGPQTVYSVRPAAWIEGDRSTAWRTEHPYWPADGSSYPPHRDKTAVAFDTKRRVFWDVGGYFANSGEDAPANKIPVRGKVASFDPAKPSGTQWSFTTVSLLHGESEHYGKAFYDPVLDIVISGTPVAGHSLQIWDCANQAFFGGVSVNAVVGGQFDKWAGFEVEPVAIDPVARVLYIKSLKAVRSGGAGGFYDPISSSPSAVFKLTLPSSRAGLPAAGSLADWSANGSVSWTNANNHLLIQGCPIQDGAKRYLYYWLRGPYVVWDQPWSAQKVNGLDPGNAIYGTDGHPNVGNGSFGSPNTGVLIDLDTGVEQFTQLPHPKFEDGQGWIIPNITHWNEKTRSLWYGSCVFEAVEKSPGSYTYWSIENQARIVKKPMPSWAAATPVGSWQKIPNTRLDDLATTNPAAHAVMVARGIGYGSGGESPWPFSGGTLRQKDAVLMVHGGGGAGAGRGNEIFGISLMSDAPKWDVLMPPTENSKCLPYGVNDPGWTQVGGATNCWFGDGYNRNKTYPFEYSQPLSPAACHSYGYQQYLDSQDMWVRWGSSMVWNSDGTELSTHGVDGFRFSETAKPYDQRQWAVHVYPDILPRLGDNSPMSAPRPVVKHPWTEEIYVAGGTEIQKIDPAVGAWSRWRTWLSGPLANTTLAIDPVQNVMLQLYGQGHYGCLYDLADSGQQQQWVLSVGSWQGVAAGCTVTLQGCVWVPDWQAFAVVVGDRNSFASASDPVEYIAKLTIDKAARTVNVTAMPNNEVSAGCFLPIPGANYSGFASRYFYSHELGGLVICKHGDQDIRFYRTSARF